MQAFCEALVAIANNDAEIQRLTDRNNNNLKPWTNPADLPDECLAYQIVDESQTGQESEQRLIEVTFSCFGNTRARAEALAARVTSEGASGMFTFTNFNGQSVNAAPIRVYGQHDASDLEDNARSEFRIDVTVLFEVEYA
jgi:hypothetical protein